MHDESRDSVSLHFGAEEPIPKENLLDLNRPEHPYTSPREMKPTKETSVVS